MASACRPDLYLHELEAAKNATGIGGQTDSAMSLLAATLVMLLQGTSPVVLLLQRAKQDFAAGKYAEARLELEQALKVAPKDAVLWSYLGMTEFRLHDTEAAVADLEKARTLDPRNPLNYFNLGMMYHERGQIGKALENYRYGVALAPDDSAGAESYARLLMESHQYREAIAPLQKLKKSAPANFSFRLALVESYLKVGMNDRGADEIQEFVKAPKCSSRDQLDLANLLMENKKVDAARWVFEQVVHAAPDSADGHAGLGLALMDLNRYQAAATEFRRAVQLEPGSAEYAMRYAETLLLLREYPAALDFLGSVRSRFGNLAEYRYQVGLAHYGALQYTAAVDDLEALVRDYPKMDKAHYFLGHSYSAVGDLKSAALQYRTALDLNPQNASYYAALGHALRRDGVRTDEAVKYLEKALQLEPSDPESMEDLAICYEKEAKYPEAQHLLEDVIRLQPERVSAHRMLARVYYRQGMKAQGERESGTAAKLESETGDRAKITDHTPPNNPL